MLEKVKITGIGAKYAKLLQEARLDRVGKLVVYEDKPQALLGRLAKVNARKQVVQRLPTEDMVRQWIDRAMHFRPEDPGAPGPLIAPRTRLPGPPGTPPPRPRPRPGLAGRPTTRPPKGEKGSH